MGHFYSVAIMIKWYHFIIANIIVKVHRPERYGLRIDGCFDLSRLKKVIGTQSMKGHIHRLSRFVRTDDTRDNRVRDAILSLSLETNHRTASRIKPSQNLPAGFKELLRTNQTIQDLWLTPGAQNDTSMHDWLLGRELILFQTLFRKMRK